MSLAILFHFLCAQHVSDINITRFQPATRIPLQPNHTETPTHIEPRTIRPNVVIQQNSRKLLMLDILMAETCWAHKKWNKIASDIKLVFYSSTVTMMHGPINIKLFNVFNVRQILRVCAKSLGWSVSRFNPVHFFKVLIVHLCTSMCRTLITKYW